MQTIVFEAVSFFFFHLNRAIKQKIKSLII